MRLHSVSLYDEQANCLWLSEGALGPDEHNLVLDALDVLGNDRSLPCYENGVEDGRVALFLPIRAPQGDLVGVAMILADLKSVGDGVLEKVASPQVRPIIQKIAVVMRASSAPKGAEAPAPIAVPVAPVLELTPDRAPAARPAPPTPQATAPAAATRAAPPVAKPTMNGKANGAQPPRVPPLERQPSPPSMAGAQPPNGLRPPVAAPAPAAAQDQSLSPQAIDDILEFELFPDIGAPSVASEDEVPMSPASSFQQSDSLAWDVTGSSLQLTDDLVSPPHPVPSRDAVPVVREPPKPAPAPRATAAKPAAQKPVAPPPVAPIPVASIPAAVSHPHTVPSLEPQPGPPSLAGAQPNGLRPPVLQSVAAQAPVLQAPVLQPPSVAPVAAAAPIAPPNLTPAIAALDLSLPAALMNGAVSYPNTVPSLEPASGPPSMAGAQPNGLRPTQTSAAQAAAKSTGATTTSKALATGNVQALTSSTQTSRTIAIDPANLILDIQPFSKLRAGGRMRRYEVLPRIPHRDTNRAPAVTDGLALQRLLAWLGSNRGAWNLEPTSFSLNLSISSIEDERFLQQVAGALKANGIAPDNLGFEIAEPLCTQRRAQVERFITLCDKLGCFVVIDDFSFDSSVLTLLRSKALRLVKIDPKLTSAALRDKLSQAMVVAIVQAVKVLGIHCAAKKVESQASLQWLTAIGCDLAQGPALSQVLPIDSLNMPQAPAGTETGKAAG